MKAPLVVVPRSSRSQDVLLMDLGLLTLTNSFCLCPVSGRPLPAVVDRMEMTLSQLQLSRSVSL